MDVTGPSSPPRWVVHPAPAPETPAALQAQGLHPVVAGILVRRGIASAEAAERFLHPRLEHLHDPFAMKGMAAAVERIATALEGGEAVLVSGDYDVDGITATALLTGFLRAAGGRVDYFIPNRFEHGYGLTPRTVEALLARAPALVITVDNGITAVDEVARLHAAGVDTVLTDHHLPRASGVPAGIVVNPAQADCTYPFAGISGVGVAFKLVMALRKVLRERGWFGPARPEPNLKAYLDLVAIGTIADMVPLVEENRVLTHHGLAVLNRPPLRPGVAALLAVGRNGSRAQGDEAVDARTVGFRLGPRLNAAGRMTDGALGVELLLADSLEAAQPLALQLDQANAERRETGDAMYAEAVQALTGGAAPDAAGLVVASPRFHEGVVGIVANRLVERFGRPAVVLAENGSRYKGSARSIPGVNVTEAITACADLLAEYGGHSGAAGCTFPKEHLEAFRARFAEACARLAAEADAPARELEAALHPRDVTEHLVAQLACLEPCGQGNPQPEFLVTQADLGADPEPLAERHLKWRIHPQLEMLAWHRAEGFAPGPHLRYAVTLGFNDFRGTRRIQMVVQDVAEHAPEEAPAAESPAAGHARAEAS